MADQQKIFFEKINSDKDPRTLQPGEYLDAWNVHVGLSEGNKSGIPSSLKGMVQVSYPLPGGINKAIGGIWDNRTQSVFGFIWNSNGQHRIVQYIPATGTVTALIADQILNFDENHLITGAELVNGELLYWTDNINQPRKLNILQAQAKLKPLSYTLFVPFLPDYFNFPSQPYHRDFVFSFTVFNGNGNQVSGLTTQTFTPYNLPSATPTQQALTQALVAALNANLNFNPYFTVVANGTEIIITPLISGYTISGQCGNYAGGSPPWFVNLLIQPTGAYSGPWKEDLITWRKLTPSCEPTATLGADPTRAANRISRLVFQFAVAYRYHDGEITPPSKYSDLAYDTLGGCDVNNRGNVCNCG